MYPQTHFLIGVIFSIILFPFFSYYILIILLASILIDFDHYTSYVLQAKSSSFSLKKAFKWHETRQWEKEKTIPFTFLHFLELLLIIFILGVKFNIFFYIFLGFIIHLPFDWIKEIKENKFKIEKYSILVYLTKA